MLGPGPCRSKSKSGEGAAKTRIQKQVRPRPYPTYAHALRAVRKERHKLSRLFRKAGSKAARARIIRRSSALIVDRVDRGLFPFWYGTKWNFHGTTVRPKKGTIACGYFVTTILTHAGFNIQRALLARQPSAYIIRTLTGGPHVKSTHNLPIRRFVEEVRKMGDGLFIVGLDFHVGFLVVRGGRVFFVHASYGTPAEVVRENALSSPILSSSRVRVVGNISADRNVILKWLKGQRFVTKRWKSNRR
jgi:hypothetical protein